MYSFKILQPNILRKVQDEEENEWFFPTAYDILIRFHGYHFAMFSV